MKRSIHNKVLGGVCAGIAKELNCDPWIIRIAFILIGYLIGYFTMPVVYLILWALMEAEQ